VIQGRTFLKLTVLLVTTAIPGQTVF